MTYSKRGRTTYQRKTSSSRSRSSSKMPAAVQKRIRAGLRRAELSKHGYEMSDRAVTRHQTLGKAVREDDGLTVFRRLNLLMVWNKNDDPDLADIARRDRDWVKKEYYGTTQWRK